MEGAFDSACRPAIKVGLMEEECRESLQKPINSYLKDRKVRVRYAGKEYPKGTEKCCVQGSIGGLVMWNLLIHLLLKNLDGRGDNVQAFGDDIVLVFHGSTAAEIERCDHVRTWGEMNKLKFAIHKTNSVATLLTDTCTK